MKEYFENYNKELSQELENNSNLNNLDNLLDKQFEDDLHTMQMKDAYSNIETIKILKNISKELSGFDEIDLIDLKSYERIISGEQSSN